MELDKLRYELTGYTPKFFFKYENLKMLVHPSINEFDLLYKIEDDLDLMPLVPRTVDRTDIKFYTYYYDKNIYSKDELLAFIFASIAEEWNIIKGIDTRTGNNHFWLKNNNTIFDPSLSIITNESEYSKIFKKVKEIKNENVLDYLKENDNLLKFYKKRKLINLFEKKDNDFSISFINKIKSEFKKNIKKQYTLDESKINEIKKYFMLNEFLDFRQVLTQQRKYYLKRNVIALHPSIDESILDEIEKFSKLIYDSMLQEYDLYFDYHNNTIGKCYGLSIMFSLFNENFKLVQGGIPYKLESLGLTNDRYYQHSWLEKDNIIYDPALRIVVPKDLYYIFVQKQDEYTKEETENILRRIGFNLTHFRDFINGNPIGNYESISYKTIVNKIDSLDLEEEGEKLISLVKSITQNK